MKKASKIFVAIAIVIAALGLLSTCAAIRLRPPVAPRPATADKPVLTGSGCESNSRGGVASVSLPQATPATPASPVAEAPSVRRHDQRRDPTRAAGPSEVAHLPALVPAAAPAPTSTGTPEPAVPASATPAPVAAVTPTAPAIPASAATPPAPATPVLLTTPASVDTPTRKPPLTRSHKKPHQWEHDGENDGEHDSDHDD